MEQRGKSLEMNPGTTLLPDSGKVCPGVFVQHYRMRPTDNDPCVSFCHSLVLQIGSLTTVEWMEGRQWRAQQMLPGSVSIHATGELPAFRLRQATEILEFAFTPQFAAQALQNDAAGLPELKIAYGIRDPQIQRLLQTFQAECVAGRPGGPLFGESLATALIAYLHARYCADALPARKWKGGLSALDLRNALDYIGDHLAADLTLAAIAASVHMSPHHFALRFRESLGVSPHQFVLEQRVEKARSLLSSSGAKLTEVALESGFSNQSHFSLHFKRRVGVTPGRYRRDFVFPRAVENEEKD